MVWGPPELMELSGGKMNCISVYKLVIAIFGYILIILHLQLLIIVAVIIIKIHLKGEIHFT